MLPRSSENRDGGRSNNLERHTSNRLFFSCFCYFLFIGNDLGTLAPKNPLLPPTLLIEKESKSFDIFRRLEPIVVICVGYRHVKLFTRVKLRWVNRSSTGTPPLTRFFGSGKNRVKGNIVWNIVSALE